MNGRRQWRGLIAAIVAVGAGATGAAWAADCGDSAGGFDAWKSQVVAEARGGGVGARGLSALMGTTYSPATIAADRSQHSFHLSLDQFLAQRGRLGHRRAGACAETIRGAPVLLDRAALRRTAGGRCWPSGAWKPGSGACAATRTRCRPWRPSPMIADGPPISTDQLHAALELVDRGILSAGTRGSMHGEVGHTQFLPEEHPGLWDGRQPSTTLRRRSPPRRISCAGTAGHRGAGYQPGEANFSAIEAWNAATVYEKALARIGAEIDAE